MDERNKVRLVRCPECENLLPELPYYSIYKCGGCDAILRAKKKETLGGGSPENPGKEEKDFKEKFEKLEVNLGKECGSTIGYAYGIEGKSDDGLTHHRSKERVMKQRAAKLVGSSVSTVETKRDLANDDAKRNVRGQKLSYQGGAQKGAGFVDRSSQQRLKHHSWDNWGGRDESTHINGYGSVKSSREIEETSPFKGSCGYSRTRMVRDRWSFDEGCKRSYGKLRIAEEQRKIPKFSYPDEGSSNYPPGLRGFSNPGMLCEELNRSQKLARLQQDRSALLWKLDELKTELRRKSGPMAVKLRESFPVDNRSAPQSYYRQCGHGPVLHPRRYDINMQNLYAFPKHVPTEIPRFDDPLQAQACQCQKPPFHDPYIIMSQRPARSCSRCYSKNAHTSLQFPPIDSGNMRISQDQVRSYCNRYVTDDSCGPSKYTSQTKSAQLHFQDRRPEDRWHSNIDSDIDAFHCVSPRRVVRGHGHGRHCHPVAGGAPLIICCNCHELLTLPKELSMRGKNRQKLQCGACSIVLSLVIENKRLHISLARQKKQISDRSAKGFLNIDGKTSRGNDNNSGLDFMSAECKDNVLSNNQILSSNVCPTIDGASHAASRGDNKSSGSDLLSADFKDNGITDDQTLNSNESYRKQDLASSSFSSTDGETLDGIVTQTKKHEEPTTLLFQDRLDDASCNEVGDRLDKENMSQQTDLEVILGYAAFPKNLVKDIIVPTETEVSFDVYLDASLPQDSIEVHKEEKGSKRSKKIESFLMGAITKRFKDLSISSQSVDKREPNVFVNGQRIPRHALIKAEKLAGRISPGNYWYDFRSGFWGVIGQPCLGIIPPFIKEFTHLMPANCAAGNTSVYVNGRELNQDDLNLLANRGLPTTKEKSYTVEFCGRVLDKDSGEEIANLGKLAPTVECLKRGFGMRVPLEICD